MAAENGPHYLSNISNSAVINPTITHVSGNVYINSSPERHGLKSLLDNVCKGAFHNAAERGDAPRCHPRTRRAIRADIMEWIQAPAAMRKLILWMYGPAGAGKTAIAQSIAEECERQGLLAASFFFGRTAAGRNDASLFVATIAYQLSLFVPDLSDRILKAIEKKQNIFSLSITVQMQALIIDPLKSLPSSPRPIFVITDGVDECGPDRDSHTALLNTLGTAISELRHIPLLFLIASRPEFEIREAFNGDFLSPLVKSLVLDTYKPDDDIKLYLDDTFKKINAQHLRLGNPLPSAWPAKHNVDFLVSKASGQFIFASTVMRFVDSPRHDPPMRLDIILGLLAPGNETPFAPLDALYLFILSAAENLSRVIEIFTVLVFDESDVKLTIEEIEALLGFTIGTVLLDMHALVFVPPPTDRGSALRIHHASLYDFFTDRSRSGDYYIDARLAHITLSRRWLNIMSNYPYIPAPLSLYACVEGFVRHYNKLSTRSREIEDDLASFRLKNVLDKISGYKDLHRTEWDNFFNCIEKNAGTRADVFPRLRDEFDAFVFERLSRYPQALQAVIPAIMVRDSATRNCVFHISLYDMYSHHQSCGLDPILLDICQSRSCDGKHFGGYGSIFRTLFSNRSRACHFYVDGGSYLALAKQIIQIIYPMPRTYKYIRLLHTNHQLDGGQDESHPTKYIALDDLIANWFEPLIRVASEDLKLAVLLRERALQYHDGDSEFRKELCFLAFSSFDYIKRCGIPYKKHIHAADINSCIICWWEGPAIDTELPECRNILGSPKASILDHLGFKMRQRRHIKLLLYNIFGIPFHPTTFLCPKSNHHERYPIGPEKYTFYGNYRKTAGILFTVITVCVCILCIGSYRGDSVTATLDL